MKAGMGVVSAGMFLALLMESGSVLAQRPTSNPDSQQSSAPLSGTAAAGGYATKNTSPMRSDSASQIPSQGHGNDQDKQFLIDSTQDANLEILSGRLALQRSRSADAKAYAQMVLQDHMQLKPAIRQADAAISVPRTPSSTMTSEDRATYDKLKGLSGDAFDQARRTSRGSSRAMKKA